MMMEGQVKRHVDTRQGGRGKGGREGGGQKDADTYTHLCQVHANIDVFCFVHVDSESRVKGQVVARQGRRWVGGKIHNTHTHAHLYLSHKYLPYML